MFDLLIRNGTIVLSEETFKADIAIHGEKIAAIGACGSLGQGKVEFDARQKYVLPGLIDPHVHMKHPFRTNFTPDDFYTTSVSAAFGGTTTILDFAIQWDKKVSIQDTVRNRRNAIEPEIVVDFGLHATPTRSDQSTIDSVPECIDLGVPSYKVYMVYRDQGRIVEDPVILGLLETMKAKSALLMVHAENSSIAEYNRDKYLAEGKSSARYFPEIKPNFVEAEAVNRAIYFNHVAGSRLYIAHLSTSEGYEFVRAARNNHETVLAETCPHYLILTGEEYKKEDGRNFLCSPPLRSKADIETLWAGLADGSIAVVSSDHCGFSLEQKALGSGDFSRTPNGLPGIETRLPLIYTEGVRKNRISMPQLANILSVNAAKIFGLYPKKGCIAPGADADLCIFDAEQENTIKARNLHGAVDWSPYEGMKVYGSVTATILRGKFIVKENQLQVEKGFGRFLPRSLK